jgi:tRNA-specific 2-thiouridylase
MANKPVVVIAMSGGVDSSVAAALLVDRGYSVIGMMLKLWSEQDAERENRCCTPDSIALARRVAAILSIPFYVLDARQVFYDSVVRPFINDYTHNLTPNPCIYCNRRVRWGFMLDHALAVGADYLATGHYARLSQGTDGIYQLLRGADPDKDQSYVLHVLTQAQLNHALFPLGNFTKSEVRQLARSYNLPVAERPDSQDLCFIGGDGDYRTFLQRYAPEAQRPGFITDHHGHVLGRHHGLAHYTIGQRKGLQISFPEPLYVLEKDLEQNSIIVGTAEQMGENQLLAQEVNWISGQPPASPFEGMIKIRYKANAVPGVVHLIDQDTIHIRFSSLIRDITPGQAAVLYNGEQCLGGGIISRKEPHQ